MSKLKVRKPKGDLSLKKGKWRVATARFHAEAARLLNRSPQNNLDTELAEIIKELVRLAREQGHLTYNDINDALPERCASPERLDQLFAQLRALEIEIVDQAEVDRVKGPGAEEDDTDRLDILDDPVRMYLKQM